MEVDEISFMCLFLDLEPCRTETSCLMMMIMMVVVMLTRTTRTTKMRTAKTTTGKRTMAKTTMTKTITTKTTTTKTAKQKYDFSKALFWIFTESVPLLIQSSNHNFQLSVCLDSTPPSPTLKRQVDITL